jgi:hypothetical protein
MFGFRLDVPHAVLSETFKNVCGFGIPAFGRHLRMPDYSAGVTSDL